MVTTKPTQATCLAALLNGIGGGLGWSIVPPLLGRISGELHVGPTMAGVVWGAAPLGIALAAPIGGALADRYGARRIAGLAMLWGALACAARALTTGPWTMAATMLAFGLHIGFVAPAIPRRWRATCRRRGWRGRTGWRCSRTR